MAKRRRKVKPRDNIKPGSGYDAYMAGVGKLPTSKTLATEVVPGAVAEMCPVCGRGSEGWVLEEGKRTWQHFGRLAPCVERYAHVPHVPELVRLAFGAEDADVVLPLGEEEAVRGVPQ